MTLSIQTNHAITSTAMIQMIREKKYDYPDNCEYPDSLIKLIDIVTPALKQLNENLEIAIDKHSRKMILLNSQNTSKDAIRNIFEEYRNAIRFILLKDADFVVNDTDSFGNKYIRTVDSPDSIDLKITVHGKEQVKYEFSNKFYKSNHDNLLA